jgi:hypothetical protein
LATAARTSASVGAPFAGAWLTLAGWFGEGARVARPGGAAVGSRVLDRPPAPATPAVGSTTCGWCRAVTVSAGALASVVTLVVALGAELVPWLAAAPQPARASAVVAIAARSRIA